jgi:SNW domain-containing protein 1
MALAAKKEREIREAATLVRAEKAGMVASSISKFNSEIRKGDFSAATPSELESRRDSEYTGKKRSREERELEEAKKERDALRQQRKREIERDRRMEVAGKKNSKSLRDEERDISEKMALG